MYYLVGTTTEHIRFPIYHPKITTVGVTGQLILRHIGVTQHVIHSEYLGTAQ